MDRADGAPGVERNCEFGEGLVHDMIVGVVVVLLGWSANESALHVAEGCAAEGCCGRSSEQMNDNGCCWNGGRESTDWIGWDDAASGLWSKSIEESSIGTWGGFKSIAGEGCSGGGGVGD